MSRIPSRTWAAAAMTCVGIGLIACTGEEPAPPPKSETRPVKLLEIGSATQETDLRFPGRVAAGKHVDLSFRVGGPLIEVAVQEGDAVAEGALVARIDPRDFRIAVDRAEAQFAQSESDYRRLSPLYEKSAVSKAQLDKARAARDVAKAVLDDSRAKLADTRLRAPFAGRVGEVFVENFQNLQPGRPIVSLVDVRTLEIQVDLPESVVAGMRDSNREPLLTATFTTAPGVELPLERKELASQADARSQTYRATLLMRQPDEINVLPGMTAEVIVRGAGDGGPAAPILVPAIAVFGGEGDSAKVWVVDPDTMSVSPRQVETGALAGKSSIQIMGGLAKGETIAVSAVSRLREGMTVRRLGE